MLNSETVAVTVGNVDSDSEKVSSSAEVVVSVDAEMVASDELAGETEIVPADDVPVVLSEMSETNSVKEIVTVDV